MHTSDVVLEDEVEDRTACVGQYVWDSFNLLCSVVLVLPFGFVCIVGEVEVVFLLLVSKSHRM